MVKAEHPAPNPLPVDGDRALDVAMQHVLYPIPDPGQILPLAQRFDSDRWGQHRAAIDASWLSVPGHILRLELAARLLIGRDGSDRFHLGIHSLRL
ncbi:hypothetical protein D3C77_430970 [compost metagenome]